MVAVLTVLIVIASIVLVLVVLVQKSKGGGLSSNFASSNAIMGVHKTTDVVEKATWGLAGFIMVLSIVCVMVRPAASVSSAPKSVVGAPAPAPTATPDLNSTIPGQAAPSAPSTPAPASDKE